MDSAANPSTASNSTLGTSRVKISDGASVLMIVWLFWVPSRLVRSLRAISSSAERTLSPFFSPCGTSAGFEPKKEGLGEINSRLTTVKLRETWCPSARHPHAPFPVGSPKTVKKYKDGSRTSRASPAACSISPSVVSKLIIARAF